MDHFTYKNGEYYADNVAVSDIANEVGTPFYCYSKATFGHHITRLHDCLDGLDHKICYAVKTNNNLDLLKHAAALNAGGDVVSAGEIEFALAAGIKAENIVFSGVAKSKTEMRYALEQGIFQFNIESDGEVEDLNEVAASMGKVAAIAVRVNPDVVAGTHAKISTGHKTSKFGIPMSQAMATYKKAEALEYIQVQGVSMHIGSQLTDLAPLDDAMGKLASYVETLRTEGLSITTVDVGGGLGVPYGNNDSASLEDYAALVKKHMEPLGAQVILEPGRMIAANAGILVTKVIRLKDHDGHHFVIVDAGMNNLLRPSLYEAYHDIIPCSEPKDGAAKQACDIVGPICETGDIFAEGRELPEIKTDDLLVIRSAGAYGAVMASTYNLHPSAAEVVVDGDSYRISRPRKVVADMLQEYK